MKPIVIRLVQIKKNHLSRISIITNAFIIALTSEFIPKMVYRGFYSDDGSLHGYVNFSLAYFDMKDLDSVSKTRSEGCLP